MFRKMFYLLSLFTCLNVSFSEAMFNSGPNNFKAYFNLLNPKPGVEDEVSFDDMRVEEEDSNDESIHVQKFQGDMMGEEDKNQNSMIDEGSKNQISSKNLFSINNLSGLQDSPIHSHKNDLSNVENSSESDVNKLKTMSVFSQNKGSFYRGLSSKSVFQKNKCLQSATSLDEDNKAIKIFCSIHQTYTGNNKLFSDFKNFLNHCSKNVMESFYFQSTFVANDELLNYPDFFVNKIINRLEISNNISFSGAEKDSISLGLRKVVSAFYLEKI